MCETEDNIYSSVVFLKRRWKSKRERVEENSSLPVTVILEAGYYDWRRDIFLLNKNQETLSKIASKRGLVKLGMKGSPFLSLAVYEQ